MYIRRIIFLLVVALGTVALAASISHYNPRRRVIPAALLSPPIPSFELTSSDGKKEVITLRQLESRIRHKQAPPYIPNAEPSILHTQLRQFVFSAYPPLIQTTSRQGDVTLLISGVAIPNSKEQRVLTYASLEQVYALLDDFVCPANLPIDRVRLQSGKLVYSAGNDDVLTHTFNLPARP